MPTTFLTPQERQAYDTVPSEISHREVNQFFTLTPDDLAEVRKGRGKALRFGFALRLCQLRWLGFFPDQVTAAPAPALQCLSEQLHLASEVLRGYPEQGPIRWVHMTRIREHLGYREFGSLRETTTKWLLPLALEHDFARGLLDALIDHLRRAKIVRPGISRLERLVTEVRDQANAQVLKIVEEQLTEDQRRGLDALLKAPEGSGLSRFQWLKAAPPQATAKHLLEWLEKIATCRSLGADHLDLTRLHPNRVKLLARRARQKTSLPIARGAAPERDALLACFLHEALRDLTDQAVEMQAQLVERVFRRAERKRDTEFAEKGKAINDKVLLLERVGRVILNEAEVPDLEVRRTVYQRVSKERLTQALAEITILAQPADFNPLAYAARSHSYLRQFTPQFLATLHFRSDCSTDALLEAITFMRQVNAEARETLSAAPTGFIPWRWKQHILSASGQVANRPLYEMCLMQCLIQALDNGQVWIEHSREHTDFRQDWIGDPDWPAARQAFLSEQPQWTAAEDFLAQRQHALDQRMADVNRQWPDLKDEVQIVDGGLQLSRLDKLAEPEGTADVRGALQRLFPRRTLPEVLVEVNGWTGFADHLTSLNPQVRAIANLTLRKLAVVMALGMNIGLENMAQAVTGMSYEELAWVADWYLREDTLRQAIVALVNFLTHQPMARHWGDGTTSSSDGQLFGVEARSLYARTNPHALKLGPSMNVYTHVADNLGPYYAQLIESTASEAAYIVDGLLYHETELRIREHYADTRGYTDLVFGLCHLLGFRFAPRLRDVSERRLFRLRRNLDAYPHIKSLFVAPINAHAVRAGWDDVLRMTVSVKCGVLPASRALRKLNAYHPESRLYKALREVGRIDKTLFLLDYLSIEAVRRRVLIGLNKGEAYHALDRALCIGQGGLLKPRGREDQANQANCLRLLATAVIVWNTVYMGEAVERLRAANYEIRDEQLSHIYPMLLQHLNLIGEYRFPGDKGSVTRLDALPLRPLEEALSQLTLGF